jgi:hypothetical protein
MWGIVDSEFVGPHFSSPARIFLSFGKMRQAMPKPTPMVGKEFVPVQWENGG